MADLYNVVCRLAELEVDSSLSDEQKQQVIDILVEEGCNHIDFMQLDEKPGRWGYSIGGRGWHHKLRQTRNDPSAGLFKQLAR